ncbi:bifunctional alpha/beta hydrolase/OsmC family protein [Corynebacterium sp. S7]
MQSVNVKFPSSTGVELAGTIDRPDAPANAYAVLAHNFAGSRHTPGASRMAKQLTNHGIATLRFDFPGLGGSSGDFADTSFTQNVADVVAAAEWLKENYRAPQLLIGHSLGGAAVLRAASEYQMPYLHAVATVGAPFDPAHSVLHYADSVSEADKNGSVTVTLGGKDLVISREFLEDLASLNPETYLPKLRKALLLVHSPIDQMVGIDNAQTIFRATRYPKSLMSLDKADHLLTKTGTAQRAADIIGTWVQQYIEPEFTPEPTTDDNAISRTARGTRFGDVVRTSGQAITTDRPRSGGGRGQGVTAKGLFMSSLAASTSQAIREAAKGMKLDDVRVEVTHITGATFERKITLYGQLNDDQKRTLYAAANSSELDDILAKRKIVTVHQ